MPVRTLLKRRCKGSNAPSVRSPVVDEEWMRPGHWLRVTALCYLQCFHTVGWHQEEHPSCRKLSDAVLWLCVWSKAQMICISSSWCHCHLIISCFIQTQIGITCLLPVYPSCPGKETVKQVSVWFGDRKDIWRVKNLFHLSAEILLWNK